VPASSLLATTIILGGAIATDAPAPDAPPRLIDRATLSYEYTPASIDRVIDLGAFQEDRDGVSGYQPPEASDDVELPPGEELVPPPRFGTEGTRRWNLHGGYAYDVKESRNRLGVFGVGFSQFIAEGLSLDMEFNGLFTNQKGTDGEGLNFNLLFRWHFIQKPRYTIYIDGGAGMLLATHDVPENGSEFNFTPQAGFGLTYDIGDEKRLIFGIKWHHISNADLYEDNPGRDSIMGYAGISFPF